MLVRMWAKKNTPTLLVGLQASKTTLEIRLAVPQKTGHSTTKDPAIPLLGLYLEEAPTDNKDTCSSLFILAIFIIGRSCKEPTCLSTEEWIQKMWYIYMMEYYSAININDFMKFLGKWVELENILSEVTQNQPTKQTKTHTHMIGIH